MAGQLILGLSILVTLHEFGHYITAKWFKMRVDKFYLFFDFLFPVPTLLNFSLFKKKIGETEYGVGWFPLGGYVSIAGMIDETQDSSTLAKEPEPWEFRAKPAWQRLIVMLGGVIINVITGIIIFVAITYNNGNNYISREEVNKNGIVSYKLGQYIGLKTGDKILKINGKDFKKFSDVGSSDIILGENSYYTIDRNGQILNIKVPTDFFEKLSDKNAEFIEPIRPFKVREVAAPKTPSMLDKLFGAKKEELLPAMAAGLQADDKIISLNKTPIHFYHELRDILEKNAGKAVKLGIERQGKIDTLSLTVSPDGKIGFIPEFLIKQTHEDYSFGQALSIGTSSAFGVIGDNIKGFKKIFKGEVAPTKALSGPIGIARLFGGIWDWGRFWFLTGLLSMALAFMNLLPIPALDGGHAIFLLYEMISGKAPSEVVLERAQQVGMIILLALMAFTFGNDLFKVIF